MNTCGSDDDLPFTSGVELVVRIGMHGDVAAAHFIKPLPPTSNLQLATNDYPQAQDTEIQVYRPQRCLSST